MPSITITITIPEMYANVLRDWESVSRTINESINLLLEHDTIAIQDNVQELADIGPSLNALHHIVRAAIWENAKKITV